jgi:hypothetical protein
MIPLDQGQISGFILQEMLDFQVFGKEGAFYYITCHLSLAWQPVVLVAAG